ncbi:hypothetical protein [Cyanobium sp. NS01]|uniref:hypothetical protein n=1 Tax=Cyanobium sp. NS01 TaxID=261284 RepID=UPI0016475C53|nr:hypothetical protein [Cyanobium sp. NS01]QNI69666.1 hypothetical protein CyaNS01_00513 [Cyanobium sp. NS01]
MSRLLRLGLALVLGSALLIAGLLLLPFSQWMPGVTVGDIPTSAVVNGSAFNRLFPTPGPGEELVFTQEKRGFSQARLKQGGEALALLAISDTTTAPEAREKFRSSADSLKGWPLVEQGQQASALLVAERFQVKVIGQEKGLDLTQRHELLEAFDLPGLAALPQPKGTRQALKPARPALDPAPNPA